MNPKGNKMKRETVEEFLKRGGKVKKLKESGRTASEVSTPPILLSIRRALKDSAGYWKQYTKIMAYTLELT